MKSKPLFVNLYDTLVSKEWNLNADLKVKYFQLQYLQINVS